MQDQFQSAIEIGERNAEMLSLAKAWCTHARADRSMMGVGLVEEMTGLPISGGRLTCDYAHDPPLFSGMELGRSALVLYEQNCCDCEHRAPGGRIPNLSTWAEPILAQQAESMEARDAAEEEAAERTQSRIAQRSLVAAQLSAGAQEIISLVNRLDETPADDDAIALVDSARLAPEMFPVEVQNLLLVDAGVLRSGALLDALVTLSEAEDLPISDQLFALALEAMKSGWGRVPAARHLATHGTAADLDSDLEEALVDWAAPSGLVWHAEPGHPEALRHYYEAASDSV